MFSARSFFALTLGLCLTAPVFAASVVGKWNGKIQMNFPPVPANATPQQKQQYELGKAMLSKASVVMTLNANKTCTFEVSLGQKKGSTQNESGTWSQSGNKITVVTTSPRSGKKDTQTMTLSADGKTLTMPTPARGGVSGKITFTKA